MALLNQDVGKMYALHLVDLLLSFLSIRISVCLHVALTSCKDQDQLTYRMSLIVDFSDCFLMVSFSLFIPSLVLLYKLKARSKRLIRFSLNIFGKNTGVFATSFMLCHVRRHVLNVMFFPPIVLLSLIIWLRWLLLALSVVKVHCPSL